MHAAAPSRLDCIAAQATARGAGERGILRLSGLGLLRRAAALLPPGCAPPEPPIRGAWPCAPEWAPGLRVAAQVWCFPGPRSATGEDLLELHLPGSQPVLDCVLAGILARGARLAQPGEFTRRALLNGRLDLVQAEAVLDLIQARHAASARAAAAILAGTLRGATEQAREALATALVEVEAGLDFEEGDAQDLASEEIESVLGAAESALAAGERSESQRAARGRADFRILLRGAPNAGKSSLFSALTGAEALVSPQAGTTRDRLEARWPAPAAGTVPWILLDGPGLDAAPADDARDAAARERAAHDAEEADLVWLCADLSRPPDAAPPPPPGLPAILVLTKADLPADSGWRARAAANMPAVAVSAARGSGFGEIAALTAQAAAGAAEAQGARLAAAARHAAALGEARAALARARRLRSAGGPQDLLAEELRAARRALDELAGAFSPEDLLDRIFARFCLGK